MMIPNDSRMFCEAQPLASDDHCHGHSHSQQHLKGLGVPLLSEAPTKRWYIYINTCTYTHCVTLYSSIMIHVQNHMRTEINNHMF